MIEASVDGYTGRQRTVDDVGAERWPVQCRVAHRKWGEGLVLRHEGDAMVILFGDAGYRTLSVDLVEAGRLLERVD